MPVNFWRSYAPVKHKNYLVCALFLPLIQPAALMSQEHAYHVRADWYCTHTPIISTGIEDINMSPEQQNSKITSDPSADNLPYKYAANNFSHKFHRPACPYAKIMSICHLELFHFRKEAISAGYMPCHFCLPPIWTYVHGSIVKDTQAPTTPALKYKKPNCTVPDTSQVPDSKKL